MGAAEAVLDEVDQNDESPVRTPVIKFHEPERPRENIWSTNGNTQKGRDGLTTCDRWDLR